MPRQEGLSPRDAREENLDKLDQLRIEADEKLQKEFEESAPLRAEARELAAEEDTRRIEEDPKLLAADLKKKLLEEDRRGLEGDIKKLEQSLVHQRRMEEGRNPSGGVEAMERLLEKKQQAKEEIEKELRDPEAYAKEKKKERERADEDAKGARERGKLAAEKREQYEEKQKKLIKGIDDAQSFDQLYAFLQANDGQSAVDGVKFKVREAQGVGLGSVSTSGMPEYVGNVVVGNSLGYKVEELYQRSRPLWRKVLSNIFG